VRALKHLFVLSPACFAISEAVDLAYFLKKRMTSSSSGVKDSCIYLVIYGAFFNISANEGCQELFSMISID
jgi:hypothetical protein